MFDVLIQAVSQLITVENILFCLAIYALVFIHKKVMETVGNKFFPKFISSNIWKEILVPMGPLGTGVILSLIIPSYPFPQLFSSTGAHIIYGLGCGLISGLVYRLVKKNLSGAIKSISQKLTKTTPDQDSETE